MAYCIRPFSAGDHMMYLKQGTISFCNKNWKFLSIWKEHFQRPWLNKQANVLQTWKRTKEWKEGLVTPCYTRPLVWSFLYWATTSRGTLLALKALYVEPLNALENNRGGEVLLILQECVSISHSLHVCCLDRPQGIHPKQCTDSDLTPSGGTPRSYRCYGWRGRLGLWYSQVGKSLQSQVGFTVDRLDNKKLLYGFVPYIMVVTGSRLDCRQVISRSD